MSEIKRKTILFLAILATAMLPACLDADSEDVLYNMANCEPSSPALDISLFRILSKDSFQGISLTELGSNESISYDSLAIVMTFLNGQYCPSKEIAVDSAQLISLMAYDEQHPAYTPLNDIMEVVLQTDEAIYPVAFDSYDPGNENQFIVLLKEAPAQAGEQQFALWYENRAYQLTSIVNLRP